MGFSGTKLSKVQIDTNLNMGGYRIINLPSPGASTDPARSADLPLKAAITLLIDGGGAALTTGLKGFLVAPFNGSLTGVELEADMAGAIVIDIWKGVYANFPPTVADSITGSNKPTISAGGIKYQDLSLSGWTKTVTKGDIVAFNIDSVSTITRVTVTIYIDKSQ